MTARALISESCAVGSVDEFAECCAAHAWFIDEGWVPLDVAVDNLQWLAERWGLVDEFGQNSVQDMIARAIRERATTSGPASDLTQADEWQDEQLQDLPKRSVYRTPQATVDAFFFVVRNHDIDYLAHWLMEHPLDALQLKKLWEAQCLTEAA